MDVKHIHFIGFDLGHGQTALASIPTHASARLEILEINNKKVQTTAFKRSDDGKIATGDRAFNSVVEPPNQLCIAFKKRATSEPEYRKNMQEYYYSTLQHLQETNQVPQWHDRVIIIGCPSEWKQKERESYQELFSNPQFPKPEVVSESRAALLHVMEQQGKTITKADLDDGAVLVIDCGSSTTDFTIIHGWNSEEPLDDFGDDLGASYFDEEIFKYSVEKNEDAANLFALIQANPNLVPMLKYLCRQAKEKYFDAPDDFAEDNVSVGYRRIGNTIFEPLVNGVLMNQLIHQPLANSQYSWIQTFQNLLQRAKNEITTRGYSLRAILLTGGASRMGFIRESIKQIFLQENPEIKFQQDPEPEFSVASGLARWGRRRYLIESFRENTKRVFDEEMPELIEKHSSEFLDILIPKLMDIVIPLFVIPGLFDWKQGKFETTEVLQKQIKQQTNQWLQTSEGIELIASVGNEWWHKGVGKEFLFFIDPLCRKHDVPTGSMNLKIPFRSESFFDPEFPFPIPLEPLVRFIGYIIFWVIVWALPLGGPIIAAFITFFAKDEVDKFIDLSIKKINMPKLLRTTVNDTEIESLDLKRHEIANKTREMISSDDEAMKNITSQILKHLRTEVEKKADEASRFIQ
ncbi:MAG: hypothetical protein IGR93_08065 [Hydrococcus sp. C42_A2020_068]|nr:hypothetical protein [Hydrococcus sp. C42_A2020_068]